MPCHTVLALTAVATVAIVTPPRRAAAQQADDSAWLARCHHHDDGWRSRACDVRVVRLGAGTRALTVNGRDNGGVAVRGWDADAVEIHARIQAEARTDADARALGAGIRVRTSGGNVAADGPDARRGAWWVVSYVILVPRRTDLRVDAHNGPISVRAVHGRMDLDAENGPMALDDVGGDVHGRTQNGPLQVTLGGKAWDGAGLDAETTNGPVVLVIPERYSAHLETGTSNGRFEVDYPMTVQGRIGRRIATDLGSGGATVRAVTENGPVVVRRP